MVSLNCKRGEQMSVERVSDAAASGAVAASYHRDLQSMAVLATAAGNTMRSGDRSGAVELMARAVALADQMADAGVAEATSALEACARFLEDDGIGPEVFARAGELRRSELELL